MGVDVPSQLRGREASTRFLAPLFEVAARKGARAEQLAEGTGCSVAELQSPRGRVSWECFMRVLSNLGRIATDEELADAGAAVLESPVARTFLLPARLLFSLEEIYRWGARADGPLARALTVTEMYVKKLGERRLRFDVELKPGYTAVREFWLIRLGIVRSVPRAFGLPRAEVTFDATDTSARYYVDLPREEGAAARVKKRVSWLLAARGTAEALARANDDLHARYLELEREVAARKAAEEQLRAELTLFSASVAHDFRAPLRAINGLASAVVEDHGAHLDDDAKDQLRRVIASAAHMGQLIDALLALSRVTRAEMTRERVDLSEVARAIVSELRALEPERQVEIEIADGIVVDGDGALLRVLMGHLLGNAWKFSRHRTPAHVSVTREGEAVRIRDDGAGFDDRHVGAIFAPFHRLHPTKEFSGVGIGLAMAERIVRRHGGQIAVTAAPDGGATFSFTLGGS